MQSVRVRRSQTSAAEVAAVIQCVLGSGYRVHADGDSTLHVRRRLARAQVSLRAEPGGTVFDVCGKGVFPVLPVFGLTTKMLSERGIAGLTAAALGAVEALTPERSSSDRPRPGPGLLVGDAVNEQDF